MSDAVCFTCGHTLPAGLPVAPSFRANTLIHAPTGYLTQASAIEHHRVAVHGHKGLEALGVSPLVVVR